MTLFKSNARHLRKTAFKVIVYSLNFKWINKKKLLDAEMCRAKYKYKNESITGYSSFTL